MLPSVVTRSRATLVVAMALLVMAIQAAVTQGVAQSSGPQTVGAPRIPAEFVENDGQWASDSLFRARVGVFQASFEQDGLVLHATRDPAGSSDAVAEAVTVRLTFDNPHPTLILEGRERCQGTRSFIRGPDPERWRTGVHAWQEVWYRNVQPGIDVCFRIDAGGLKYDVVLEPGADLSRVTVSSEGLDRLEVDERGTLRMHTPAGPLEQPRPATHEVHGPDQVPVDCRFRVLARDRFGWSAPDWSGQHRLLIDPALVGSTFLGSTQSDLLFAQDLAANGDVVLAGETGGFDFPVTPGAYQKSQTQKEGFLARLDRAGTTLVHSTYYGGSGLDSIWDLEVDDNDVATFCGWTDSTDFPVTSGVIRPGFSGGNSDAFVARMSVTEGSTPLLSTYWGAAGDEVALQCLVEDTQGIYVCGITTSTSFPLSPQPYDATYNGNVDCFLSLLPKNGKRILGSTYLGGSGSDGYISAYYVPLRLAYDGTSLIVASQTGSADFPTTSGTFQDTKLGGYDNFITKMDPGLGQLQLSTFLGGNGGERLYAMDVTPTGDIVLGGTTGSFDYWVTPNAYDQTYDGIPGFFVESYVSQLTPNLDQLTYSTFLGGKTHDILRDLKVESRGTVVAVGTTDSIDFPVTPGAYDGTKGGASGGIAGQDGFLVRLDPAQGTNGLLYSTFLGGDSLDLIKCVTLGPSEGAYHLAGDTVSDDFPVTAGAYDPSRNASQDVFYSLLQLAAWVPYGPGLAGTLGVPDLTLNADPIQGTTVSVDVENSRGVPTLAMAFVGVAANPASGGNPGELHVDPLLWVRLSLPAGITSYAWPVPTGATYCGLEVYLQILQGDPGAVGGISYTPGLKMVLGG